jgi:hypothetical protein
MKFFLLQICILIPFIVFCQKNDKDSLDTFLEKECAGGRIFTKTEKMPSVKKGENRLADSLISFLRISGKSISSQKVTYRFVVTKNSQIADISFHEGSLPQEENLLIKEALIKYQFMWQCAIQNGFKVCAYAKLEMDFSQDKLLLRVF